MNVVWILGAGFSKPLGGPLLVDFFSPPFNRLAKDYDAGLSETVDRLADIYQYDAVRDEKQWHTVPWRNAEEFIEYLEMAAAPGGGGSSARVRALLQPHVGGTLEELDCYRLAMAARCYLNAVCSGFTDDADTARDTERWLPYRRWTKQLTVDDTIITFNYDRVVEAAMGTPQSGDVQFATPTPEQAEWGAEWDPAVPGNAVRLLKLHGSVDWWRQEVNGDHPSEKTHVFQEKPSKVRKARTSVSFEPLLVGPGPRKLKETTGAFRHLWSRSEEAIRGTQAIVFIGYRFPETDAESKRRLLDAIAENEQLELTVRIVLGPDRNRDVARLEGMLRRAFRRRRSGGISRIVIEPMWAEDYLTVFYRDHIGTVESSDEGVTVHSR